MTDILQKITLQRNARNWTEYQLAVRSGLPQSTISSWYRKKMLPSLTSLEKICSAFDMSMAQFLADESFTELGPEQQELIEKWEFLTPSQKKAFLALMDSVIQG